MTHYDTQGCGYEFPGEAKAATEPAEYPAEWKPQQRLTAYWYAIGHHITIDETASWYPVLDRAEEQAERRHTRIDELRPNNIIRFPKRKQPAE